VFYFVVEGKAATMGVTLTYLGPPPWRWVHASHCRSRSFLYACSFLPVHRIVSTRTFIMVVVVVVGQDDDAPFLCSSACWPLQS